MELSEEQKTYRRELINELVESWHFPRFTAEQAVDMADMAMKKARDAAKVHIELHSDQRVRELAITLFMIFQLCEAQEKQPLIDLSLKLMSLRAKSELPKVTQP